MDDDLSDDETVAVYDEFVKPEDLNVSPLIHVGSFVSQWESVLDTVDYLPNSINPVNRDMMCELLGGANKEIVKELEGVCDPHNLKAQMAVKKPVDKMELDEAVHSVSRPHRLSTLQFRMDCLKNLKVKTMHAVSMTRGKFRATRNTWEMEYSHLSDPNATKKRMVQPVTLLQMSLFKPHLVSGKERDSKIKMLFDREFLLLSTGKLKDITPMITCVTDEVYLAEERSEYPDLPEDVRAKDVFKSSFFFIENVFYINTSDSCKDISEPIRKWASQGRPGVATKMKVEPIEGIVLEKLNIRLGYPYLYCHQGDCEHVFMFSDIRLMHDMDCKDLDAYPRLINKCSAKRVACIVCNLYTARWVTRDDHFSPADPAFFCDKCFRMLHYDEHGKKLGRFKAWPYTDIGTFS